MAHLLGAESVRIEYPTKVVFDSLTVGIGEGDRIGIVGRNGDGKTTLLRLLAAEISPDSGQVIPRSGLRIGYLSQNDQLDPALRVAETIVGDLPEHVWAGNPQNRQVIKGLVSDIPWESLIGNLSGGQQRRVALAALLIQDWDLIILDEPTNHLDLQGISWLANHLQQRWGKNAGGLLVVTHDRWFLDEICTATWEVHDGIVEPFEGGYAAYILQRVERDRQLAATENKRQNLMRKELAWLRRGAPARTSKPKFRMDAASQLISDIPEPRDSIELSRLATNRLGKNVVDLLDVGVSFGDHIVLQDVTWRIAPGERTGILGANGAGKSTLLNLISGILPPTAGRVRRGKTVELAILDQQFRELAEIADDRVRDVMAKTQTSFEVDGKELTPSQLLERLGFSSAHLSSRVRELSGGQKRRLQLLLILLSQPNVLILDEPTNDVDTDMLAAMEDLLDTWPGTLIIVSHDRYLIERATDQQYAILDQTLRHLPGGVDEYLRRSESAPAATAPTTPAETEGMSGRDRRELEKEISSLERRISKLQQQAEKGRFRLADHDQTDYSGLSKKMAQISDWESQAADLEDEWLGISEQLG